MFLFKYLILAIKESAFNKILVPRNPWFNWDSTVQQLSLFLWLETKTAALLLIR